MTLPTYPFERQRYWFTAPTSGSDHGTRGRAVAALPGPLVHPLLGRRLDLAGREIIYETDLQCVDYLADHRLGRRGRISHHRLPGVGLGGRP